MVNKKLRDRSPCQYRPPNCQIVGCQTDGVLCWSRWTRIWRFSTSGESIGKGGWQSAAGSTDSSFRSPSIHRSIQRSRPAGVGKISRDMWNTLCLWLSDRTCIRRLNSLQRVTVIVLRIARDSWFAHAVSTPRDYFIVLDQWFSTSKPRHTSVLWY